MDGVKEHNAGHERRIEYRFRFIDRSSPFIYNNKEIR